MTEKDLQLIRQLILAAKDDFGRLTIEEVEHLDKLVSAELYNKRIVSFKNYLRERLDIKNAAELSDHYDTVDCFDNEQITVMFGDKSVNLENCPTVFFGILDMLQEHIDNRHAE